MRKLTKTGAWFHYLRCFFFSSRRRHTRCSRDWSSDVCSSDLIRQAQAVVLVRGGPLVGETGAVEGGVEEISRAVAGEHPAGAVAAVSRRRQAHEKQDRKSVV